MKRLKLLLLLVLSLPMWGMAQFRQPVITSSVTPDTIRIGDICTYTIEVERDIAQVSHFPLLGPTEEGPKEGMADVEVVEELPIDTLRREGRIVHLRKRYRLQLFDEGRIALGRGAILFADKNIIDTLYGGDSVYLFVEPILIDSAAAAQGLKPMKPQREMPLKFGEFSLYLLYGLLALLLVVGLVLLILRHLARMGKRVPLFKPAPQLPPHVVAIRALEALHHRKLWQTGNFKLYYSELTDILRHYIAGRYAVGAMEMTSDEILVAMRALEEPLPQKAAMDLCTLLQEADLVKFAKAEPSSEENEAAYNKAYYFVEETKLQEEQPSEGEGMDNA